MASRAQRKRNQRQDEHFDPRFRNDHDPKVLRFEGPRRNSILPANVDRPAKLVCRNESQKAYANLIRANTVTFGLGPAGTGKTHVATVLAAEALQGERVKQVYISRPAQGMEDEDMGFIPGTIHDKFEPWFKPVRTILEKHFGRNRVECMIENEQIVVCPMLYLSGLTFEDAFVIVDEAQNTSVKTMKRLLTRIGPSCTMVLNGDTDQVDIKGVSGLTRARECLEHTGEFGFFEFGIDDVVRDPIVKTVLRNWKD